MGYQLSRPAGGVLHGVRKFFDRLFGVTIFNAFLDTMLQMPFQNNLSHTMYRALYCVDLNKDFFAGHILIHHFVDRLHLTENLIETSVKIRCIHAFAHKSNSFGKSG